jgi:hypothetical protein
MYKNQMQQFAELYKKYLAGSRWLDGLGATNGGAGRTDIARATDEFLERVIIPMRDLWHNGTDDMRTAFDAMMLTADKFGATGIKFVLTVDEKGDKVSKK